MKICPYCRKKIGYGTLFRVKNKGSYKCRRCEKESKVKISGKMIILFVALCLLVALISIMWVASGNTDNILGVVIVASLVLIFYFLTPLFLQFLPVKKYMNDVGNNKAYEEKVNVEPEIDFTINKEAFDKIKRQRERGRLSFESDEISSSTKSENFVPVIEDVKEGHISSSDGPLQKINRTPKQYEHKYEEVIEDIKIEEEVKQYIPKKKRTEGTKYTGNRRL